MSNVNMIGTLLTVTQVAEILQSCERKVRREIAAKRLPCIRIGRSIRVSMQDLDRYIAANRHA